MGVAEEMNEILTLSLNDASGIHKACWQYRHKKLTREQFIAAVEEMSMKIMQRVSDCLCFEQQRAERCKVCDTTYPASEIVIRDGEQLCEQCDNDKYPIKPEDIPF